MKDYDPNLKIVRCGKMKKPVESDLMKTYRRFYERGLSWIPGGLYGSKSDKCLIENYPRPSLKVINTGGEKVGYEYRFGMLCKIASQIETMADSRSLELMVLPEKEGKND